MTNEQILNKRWKNIDKFLSEYLKEYNKLNRKTKDGIQSVFDSFDIEYSDINKNVSKTQKDRLDRFILNLQEQGLLIGYYGYEARKILNKKNVTYSEMLKIMIQGIYIKENNKLDEINNNLYYKTCEESYNQGLDEINKKSSNFFDKVMFGTLISIPILNMTAKEYMMTLALTNADELYKQTLVNIQAKKELDVDNKNYEKLFNKQKNRIIDIKENKLSGGIPNIVTNLSNLAYLQAGKDNNVKQCRFIAEIDKRTTKMCYGMDNMLFNIDDWNRFYRYSALDDKDVLYTVKGLEQGVNLPPITNHFHWCRSTITYQIEEPRKELNKNLQSFSEKLAIRKWLSSDFYSINYKMYNNKKLTNEDKKLIKDLYKGLNKEPYYIAKDDEYIIRTIEVDKETLQSIINQHPIDGIYETKAFESYSLRDDYNPNANVYFYVKGSKKARNLLQYNSIDEEAEVLYQYGTKFKTKAYEVKRDKHYFLLEEFDE